MKHRWNRRTGRRSDGAPDRAAYEIRIEFRCCKARARERSPAEDDRSGAG